MLHEVHTKGGATEASLLQLRLVSRWDLQVWIACCTSKLLTALLNCHGETGRDELDKHAASVRHVYDKYTSTDYTCMMSQYEHR
jgi:hypothetical protein